MQWTYPYAQWYGPYAQEAPDMPEEYFEEPPAPIQEKLAASAPKIQVKEFSAQKDFDFDQKPDMKDIMA
jgi:hypothetical protein